MATTGLGLVQIESETPKQELRTAPTAPLKAFPRTYHSIAEPIELDSIQPASGPHDASISDSFAVSGAQSPLTPGKLESGTISPADGRGEIDMVQSFSNPPINRFRMLAVSLLSVGNGLGDSAPGALIPYIEKYYGIGYAIVSLIFISNAVGFISAAFVVDPLRAHFGRGKTLMIAELSMACGFIPIVCTAPFPGMVVGFFFLGLGEAINLSMANTFTANLHNGTNMLGILHGSYGVGGTIGPLIATAMVTSGNLIWSRYYLIPMSMAIFNLCFSGWSFWNYEADSSRFLITALEREASQTTTNTRDHFKEQIKNMATAFKSKVVILGSLFIFAYQGAEVSISGWIISFLITTREGDPSHVGYVTSGFWAGITIGRFVLSHPAHRFGVKLFAYAMIVGAAASQLLVWLVPNVIGDAVAVSIVGLLLGPIYPCAMTLFARSISRKQQVSSMSVISAFGSSGGAVAPFMVGLLAQVVGTFVLHPIVIGLFAMMIGCWFMLPNVRKRSE